LRAIVLIAGMVFCSNLSAQTPAWTIQPNICVAQRVGDECQLTFSIETQSTPSELLCLFLEGELLTCSQQAYFHKKISISIKQNTLIELRNRAQQTILSKTLLIKYIEPNDQRRRIRPPWSLF
jgi:hypothetical protein